MLRGVSLSVGAGVVDIVRQVVTHAYCPGHEVPAVTARPIWGAGGGPFCCSASSNLSAMALLDFDSTDSPCSITGAEPRTALTVAGPTGCGNSRAAGLLMVSWRGVQEAAQTALHRRLCMCLCRSCHWPLQRTRTRRTSCLAVAGGPASFC